MAGKPREGSRAISKPATSPSSRYPRLPSLVSAKRRPRRGATSSIPSRLNLIGWSQPFGAFLPTGNDALQNGRAGSPNRRAGGFWDRISMIDWPLIRPQFQRDGSPLWRKHPTDSEQLRSAPRTCRPPCRRLEGRNLRARAGWRADQRIGEEFPMPDMTRSEFIALVGGSGLLLATKVRR